MHVDDFVAAVTDALDCAPSGSVFNMVDEPMKQGEYLEHLAHIIGAELPQDIPSENVPPSQRCSNCRASARCLDGDRRAASGQMPLPARVRRTLQNPAQANFGERPSTHSPGEQGQEEERDVGAYLLDPAQVPGLLALPEAFGGPHRVR